MAVFSTNHVALLLVCIIFMSEKEKNHSFQSEDA